MKWTRTNDEYYKKLCRRQREQLKFCISNKAMPRTKDSMSLFDCNQKLETEERVFELKFPMKSSSFKKHFFPKKQCKCER